MASRKTKCYGSYGMWEDQIALPGDLAVGLSLDRRRNDDDDYNDDNEY